MRIYFVRHGQTDSNLLDALDTDIPGAALNGQGRAQATALPGHWRDLGLPRLDGIVTSPLLRTRQTAAALAAAHGLVPVIDRGVREVRAGDLEMLYVADAPSTYLAVVADWLHGKRDRRMPGGESGYQVIGRVNAALRRAAQRWGEEAAVAVVAHGCLIRYATASLVEGISPELAMSEPLRNCSITAVEGTPEQGWSARLYSSKPIDEWEVPDEVNSFRRSIQVLRG